MGDAIRLINEQCRHRQRRPQIVIARRILARRILRIWARRILARRILRTIRWGV